MLIAPGGRHLLVYPTQRGCYKVRITNGPKVCRQRPSVDVLFNSVAKNAGSNAVGVLLTGMGKDGADGLLKIKRAGGFTLAEDERSCIVFGMPKEAIALGAAEKVVRLDSMAKEILLAANRR